MTALAIACGITLVVIAAIVVRLYQLSEPNRIPPDSYAVREAEQVMAEYTAHE